VDLAHTAVRALAAFLFLLVLLRVSGTRAVAQASPFDFVLALILGELVDKFLTAHVSARQFLVATGTLAVLHAFTSLASHASPAFARLVEGEPVVFQRGGAPVAGALRGERLSGGEVQEMLRHHGLDRPDWDQVAEARLETSGRASVTAQGWAREAQKQDAPGVRALRHRR
jgi:uncharacterized membrane protein YcaP (DUF421 family)